MSAGFDRVPARQSPDRKDRTCVNRLRIKPATGRGVLAATIAALAAGGAGVAVAAIPGGGQIDGRYSKVAGVLRVIDRAKGETCNAKLETPIGWNQLVPPEPPALRAPRVPPARRARRARRPTG